MRAKSAIAVTLVSIGATSAGSVAFADCDRFIAQAQATAAAVTVKIEDAERTQAGAPIKIDLRIGERRQLEHPVYFVATTSPDVRFGGQGFIALTAGAKGPWGIAYGAGGARAIVPLQLRTAAATGSEIAVKTYRRGAQTINWAVVTAGPCGERILTSGTKRIDVSAGPPELIVQDRFATGAPRQRFRSRDGNYDLYIFAGRYEVRDVTSGDKIIDRPGVEPNFSPTGRFIAARREPDKILEVIDLVSGRQFNSTAEGLLAWVRNDSYVIYGRAEQGEITLWNTIVDGDAVFEGRGGMLSCMACGALRDLKVVLDIERGYFAAVGQQWRVVDLATRQVGPAEAAEDDRLTREGKIDEVLERSEKRKGPGEAEQPELSLPYIRKSYDPGLSSLPRGWDVREPMKLSHLDPKDAEAAKAKSWIVRHGTISTSDVAVPAAVEGYLKGRARSGRNPDNVGSDIPKADQSGRGPKNEAVRTEARRNIFARLAEVGVPTEPSLGPERIFTNDVYRSINATKETRTGDKIAQQIRAQAPAARALFRESDQCDFAGAPKDAILIDPKYIAQVWRWRESNSDRWLIQTMCYLGAAGRVVRSDLFLLTDKTVIKLTELIDGAHDVPRAGALAPRNEERARLSGESVFDDATRVNVFRVGETLVAITLGNFKIRLLDTKLVLLSGAQIPLIDGALTDELRLTQDGRHLVQLNKDGRLFVHRLADGKRMFVGAHVDDEIVLATPEGLYETTFEGAQAIQVRFPGERGLYRYYQFEAALRRTGLAKALLSGSSVDRPPPGIPVPPAVQLSLAVGPSNGRRTGKVVATAERSLAAVRLYIDGRLVQTIPVTGRASESAIDLPDPGGGRWITAVAVDTTGLVSLPSAVQMPGAPKPRGTLRAILVGVDSYDDPALPRLSSAKEDAQRLAQALKVSERRAAGEVRMDLLIGDHITPAAVLAAMREQAEATAPDDMLVIFYAGHGISNRASGRSKADLMLTLPKTRMTDLGTTALPWTAIADALAEARGTVMVILDACHSGIAGSEAFTTNDDAVSALFTRAGAPMVVLAGSKGRQASLENPATKTGLFTGAIAAALAGQRTRQGRDRQGLLDLGEFYAAVKARVVNESAGRQTPWLTRNGLVGEMVLF